jgi:hypothetical protein
LLLHRVLYIYLEVHLGLLLLLLLLYPQRTLAARTLLLLLLPLVSLACRAFLYARHARRSLEIIYIGRYEKIYIVLVIIFLGAGSLNI